jgi:two-component system response regulator FixJ
MTKRGALARLAELSPREMQVAVRMAEGDLPAQISKRLKLSAKTVQAHRQQILRKAGVSSTAQLAILMFQAGKVIGP